MSLSTATTKHNQPRLSTSVVVPPRKRAPSANTQSTHASTQAQNAKAEFLLPTSIRFSRITGRSLMADWTNSSDEDLHNFDESISKKMIYQLSRSDAKNEGVYKVLYEGSAKTCIVQNLIPLTMYKFKVLVKFEENKDPDGWSRKATAAEITTTDESDVTKAYSEAVRAIIDDKPVVLQGLVTKFGMGLDLNTRDKTGRTFLMLACQHSGPQVISILLNSGANPELCTKAGKSPISQAVTSGNIKAIECLLSRNVDINKSDNGGSSPLMWCCDNAHNNLGRSIRVIELLLKNGANVHLEDYYGQTAFDRVCKNSGSVKVAELLVEYGAKQIITTTEKNPNTSLMTAATNGHHRLCEWLIENDADLDATSPHGVTAKDIAYASTNKDLVQVFKRAARQNSDRL